RPRSPKTAIPDIDFASTASKPPLSQFAVRILGISVGLVVATIGAAIAQDNRAPDTPFAPVFEEFGANLASRRAHRMADVINSRQRSKSAVYGVLSPNADNPTSSCKAV